MSDLCFSVLSDVHVTAAGAGRDDLKRALAYHARLRNDAVVFTGDILYQLDEPPAPVCHAVYTENYDAVTADVDAAFPSGTKQIWVMGNHEYPQQNTDRGLTRKAFAVWRQKLGRPLDGHTVVNGYHFIWLGASSWDMTPDPAREARARREIESALADGNGPVFFLSHGAHPAECRDLSPTCYISPEFYAFMRTQPRLIHLFGHYHTVAHDDSSIRQDGFTSVSCPICSVGYACFHASQWQDPLFFGISQSLYVRVEGTRVRIDRIDLHGGKVLPDSWEIDVAQTAVGVWAYTDDRSLPVNEFSPGTELRVRSEDDRLVVLVPQRFETESPVCYYRAEVTDAAGQTTVTVKPSDFAYLPQGKPLSDVWTLRLPRPAHGRCTIRVFPENCLHRSGRPLIADLNI
ncbi:MAG: metallophosphoesterase [Eubacteriales bacterium]|nr:metallophosphoesterase [Eubacteriales bacterium]